jgi:hypothetical protein
LDIDGLCDALCERIQGIADLVQLAVEQLGIDLGRHGDRGVPIAFWMYFTSAPEGVPRCRSFGECRGQSVGSARSRTCWSSGAAESFIEPIGLALPAAVLFDASVGRMTVVPAVMTLLGHTAWWLRGLLSRRNPQWLRAFGVPWLVCG